MRSIRRRVVCLLAGASLFAAAGGCQLEEWKLAIGPVFSGGTVYGGVELEFSNGVDFIIPMVPLGDNLDGGWKSLGHGR